MTDYAHADDSPAAGDGFDQLSEPGPLLRRCHQRSREIYARLLGDDAPTRHQLAIMIAIEQLSRPSQADICARTGIDRNTVADIVRRLVKRGYVRRVPHAADSRAVQLHLTKAGEAMLADFAPKVFDVQSEILAPLPEHVRSEFLICLRMVAGIERMNVS